MLVGGLAPAILGVKGALGAGFASVGICGCRWLLAGGILAEEASLGESRGCWAAAASAEVREAATATGGGATFRSLGCRGLRDGFAGSELLERMTGLEGVAFVVVDVFVEVRLVANRGLVLMVDVVVVLLLLLLLLLSSLLLLAIGPGGVAVGSLALAVNSSSDGFRLTGLTFSSTGLIPGFLTLDNLEDGRVPDLVVE